MAKPTSQERRKQVLRQRRAEEQREFDREEAGYLFETPSARTVPVISGRGPLPEEDPDPRSQSRRRHGPAGPDPSRRRALRRGAWVPPGAAEGRYRSHGALRDRRAPAAVGPNREGDRDDAPVFVAMEVRRKPEWQRLRNSAESFVQLARPKPDAKNPRRPASASASAAPRPTAPEKPPEPPRAAVRFFPTPRPPSPIEGTVADYFLRRQWMELRMAQSFEDLLCLPSLHGVDTYIYQQETVRKVLRHFKGRALLADEVGLGQNHRSLPGAEGILDARPGAQSAGAHAAFAGAAMEGRTDRKVRPGPGLSGWRRIPPRPAAVLGIRTAGGLLHRPGAAGACTPRPSPPCPGTW